MEIMIYVMKLLFHLKLMGKNENNETKVMEMMVLYKIVKTQW